MDIRQLRYFVMVYEEMSFTKAARRLYVSQPTLSKAIKSMELELDEPLFDRDSSELRLTDVGEALLARARVILKEFDGINASALNLKYLQSGRIAIALPPIISTLYFTEIIDDFRHHYPGITVTVREIDAVKVIPAVQDETFDLGVGIQPISVPDLIIRPLCYEQIVAVMKRDNPLAQKESITFSDLRHQPLNLFSEGFFLNIQTLKRCRDLGFEPTVNVTSSQWEFLTLIARTGNGISILPLPVLPPLPDDMCWRPFEPKYSWDIMIFWKMNHTLSYAARAFVERTEHLFTRGFPLTTRKDLFNK